MQSCLEPLGQHGKGFSVVQCYPNSIKTTLHKIFSDTKLSRASRTPLDKVLSCAMLSQEY